MRRFVVLVLVVAVLGSHLDGLEDPFFARSQGMGVELAIESLRSGDFRLGDRRYDWRDGSRSVLAVRSRVDLDGRLEPLGGIDFWWDDREAAITGGNLTSNALGFHLVSALAIHLLPQADRRRFTLAVVPALHGGIGLQMLSLRTVPSGTLDLTDEVDLVRLELGVGIGLRAAFSQRWVAECGVGARLWSGGSATINGQDLNDPTVTDSAISMSGKETFLRFSLGWWW